MLYLLPQNDIQLDSCESIKKCVKTEQQIKKYTIQQDLDESKRTVLLLSKGDSLQRRSVIQSLFETLSSIPSIKSNVISIIKEIVATLDSEIQIILIQQIIKILPIVEQTVLIEFTQMTLRFLPQWKNQRLSLAWLQLFSVLVTKPTFPELQRQIIQCVLKLSQPSQILPMKMISARMISHLSYVMKNKLKGMPLDRVRAFCRDSDKQLRRIVLKEVMPCLFKNLGIQLINIYFLQKVFEMIYDSDKEIKISSINLFIQFYPILSVDDKERFYKILMQHLQQPNNFDFLSPQYGDIYLKIKFQLQRKSDVSTFISSFRLCLMHEDHKIRYHSIFNLPGLLLYMGLKIWSEVKKQYFEILLKQQNAEVRALAVSIYHQVLKIMQSNDFERFPDITLSLIKSFQNKQDHIIFCFLSGFPTVFQILKRTSLELSIQQKDNTQLQKTIQIIQTKLIKLFQNIQKGNEIIQKNHYLVCKYHQCINKCMKYMNTQILKQLYFPVLCSAIKISNNITLSSILSSLSELFYQLIRKQQILPLVEELTNTILINNNSQSKIKYIKLANNLLLNCFSTQKYKELGFFDKCKSFVNDKIIDVRIQLAVYFQNTLLYFQQQSIEVLDILFQSEQIKMYVVREERVQTADQKEYRTRRNTQCLKNQQLTIPIIINKKQQNQKRNFVIRNTTPYHNQKSKSIKIKVKAKGLTTSSTSSQSLLPINTFRQDTKSKIQQQPKRTSKSIRRIVLNKIIPEHETIEKRTFQSISFQRSKVVQNINTTPLETSRKRRKTINQKKQKRK